MLSKHPEVEQKLYEEIIRVLGTSDSITIDKIEKLTYLDNVIKETMRLYPPVAITSRISVKDDTLSGHHIPAGVRILILCLIFS
jgi:cytochrome P450